MPGVSASRSLPASKVLQHREMKSALKVSRAAMMRCRNPPCPRHVSHRSQRTRPESPSSSQNRRSRRATSRKSPRLSSRRQDGGIASSSNPAPRWLSGLSHRNAERFRWFSTCIACLGNVALMVRRWCRTSGGRPRKFTGVGVVGEPSSADGRE